MGGGGGGVGGGAGSQIRVFKANFTLNFPIGWSWSLRFDPI